MKRREPRYQYGLGQCSVCRSYFGLHKDGTLRTHKRGELTHCTFVVVDRVRCEGSKKPPKTLKPSAS